MGSVQVTVIGRDECHLCDDATRVIEGVLTGFHDVTLDTRKVEENPEWLEFYTGKVPVILIDGVEHGYWHVNERIFRGALVQAGALPRESDSE